MRSNNASVKYYVKLPDNGNVMYTIRSDRYIMSTKLSSTGVLSLRSFQKRQKTDQKTANRMVIKIMVCTARKIVQCVYENGVR